MQRYWEKFECGANRTRDLPHLIKWWWQRLFRGYDDRDIWNLDKAIIRFIYPRLDFFVTWQCEHGMHYPADDMDPAAWLNALKKMREALKLLSKPKEWTEEEEKTIKEGTELLGKYLRDLYD